MTRIIYIDDDIDLLLVGKRLLEKFMDISVTTVSSAHEALSLLRSDQYDLVIADYQMPRINGIELLKTIRKEFGEIPFILFTGKGSEEVVIEAINNGADFYLQKGGDPVSQFVELAQKVNLAIRRRDNEHAVQESEEKFRCIVQRSSDIIYIVNSDFRFTYISPSVERILGYSPDDLINQPSISLMCEEEIALAHKIQSNHRKGIPVVNYQLHVRRENGSIATLEMNSDPIFKDGTFFGVQVAARDISERVNNIKIFKNLADSLPFGLVIISPGFSCEYVNAAFIEITGYSSDEVYHPQTWLPDILKDELDSEKGVNLNADNIKDHLNSPFEQRVYDLVVRDQDGITKNLILIVMGLINDSILLIAHEKNQQLRTIEAILTANKKLNLMSSITRHDILNLIMVVKASIFLLNEEGLSDDQIELFNTVKRSIDSIETNITFTRDYQDLGVKAPTWMDLNDAFNEVFVAVQQTGIKGGAPQIGVLIYVDSLFRKVIANLIDNSLFHGGNVTSVSYLVEETDDGLLLIYTDDGCGILYEEKERIFERGFGKNTGLGLFLIREILSITGICIKENGVPGEGARFEMVIPRGGYAFKPKV